MSKTPQRWEWAIGLDLEQLDEKHLQEAYKLNWDNLCKFDNCRKNCKRILCLACFDKTWIDNDCANSTYDSFETSNCEQKRADLKSFVGLKNLGATCYVNCLLQLWFHNPALRKAIYEWDNIADNNSNNSNNNSNNSNNNSNNNNNNNNSSDRQKIENSSDHPKRIKSLDNDSNVDSLMNTPSKRPRISSDEASANKKPMNSNSENCTALDTINNHHNNNNNHHNQTSTTVAETKSSATTSSIDNYQQANTSTTDLIQSNPIEQLQLIFARLQFTNKKSIDPFNFIESLALNATEQQDAQEFGNLFIEFLEKSFANQRNRFVSNIIKSQFLGRYSYATICDHCRHSSVSDSNFYELDLSIQNLDTLHECLNEYFRPVPLDGKYNCSHCQRAQSAHRKIILKSVPPTLNLQLLRFVYDKQRNTRQKLNSFIMFPEILDMTPYLNESNRKVKQNPFDLSQPNGGVRDRSNLYILSAVLIHRGSSPHSGHYIAHIKDRVTKDWFKFNDDSVERIGPQLQVSTDGENITIVENETNYVKFNDPASGKVIKLESKSLKSKTAYMLVYQAHDNEALTYPSDNSEKWILPDHLQCAVAEENSKSDELFESLQIAREVDQQVMDARRAQIRTIYDKLVCRDPSDKFEFIDRNWLQNWITNSSTTAKFSPIDNSHLLCIHDKLDFRKLDQVKCVRTEGADLLYKEFGGGPRLLDAMCKKCVVLEVKLIQLKDRMKEDQKFITSQAKFKLDADYSFSDAYVVGRNSYRDWQSLVMVQFEKSNPELANRGRRGHGTSNSSDEEENKTETTTTTTVVVAKDNSNPEDGKVKEIDGHESGENVDDDDDNDDDDAIEKFVFNSDILCEHGNLLNDTTAWRIVPKEVWSIFKRYFDDNPERPLLELDANHLMCAECRRQEAEQQEIGDIQKQIAVQQKSKLPDLFHNRKRASWCTMIPGDAYYALDRQFLTKWQKFLRNPCNQEQPSSVNNSEKLACKHKLTLYNSSNSNPILPECPFALLSLQEMANLREFYTIDHVIKYSIDPILAAERLKIYKASQKTTPKKSNSAPQESVQNYSRPSERCDSGDHNNHHQTAAQITGQECALPNGEAGAASTVGDQINATSNSAAATEPSTSQQQPASQQQSSRPADAEIDPTDIDWSECVVSDPPYCSECHELLKQNELKKLLNYESATIYITKFENRTARRNRSREQAYTIRSNQTLLELKKEIFNRCQVLPVDQRLFLNEILLDDNSKTMSELRVVPNCSLKLEIDRPMSDTIDLIEDESTSRKSCAQPETGFKGSLLLSNNHF